VVEHLAGSDGTAPASPLDFKFGGDGLTRASDTKLSCTATAPLANEAQAILDAILLSLPLSKNPIAFDGKNHVALIEHAFEEQRLAYAVRMNHVFDAKDALLAEAYQRVEASAAEVLRLETELDALRERNALLEAELFALRAGGQRGEPG
jgi:hypothetical protein